ncbi:hypothetical protein PSHT_13227 [Puccinia striiformis]|uniref:Uncharacterized protein n=1 Tax=Puccinia striiformis TaxID=27350 RepID=A0A2S4US81_9BASI|nr:hypothetical protein PSHT_13227 [Puccinia striiformis]
MSAQLLNMAIPLVGMQVARKIPFDDPQVLFGMRMAYVTSQVLCLSAYYWLSHKIKTKNDTTVLKYSTNGKSKNKPQIQKPDEVTIFCMYVSTDKRTRETSNDDKSRLRSWPIIIRTSKRTDGCIDDVLLTSLYEI